MCAFPEGISPKVNLIALQNFELSYIEATIQLLWYYVSKNK